MAADALVRERMATPLDAPVTQGVAPTPPPMPVPANVAAVNIPLKLRQRAEATPDAPIDLETAGSRGRR
jgi:hypothetical protein